VFIEAKDDGGGDTWTTGAISRAKLQSNHPVFLQTGCPSCRPTNSVKALKGKYHIPRTYSLQVHLGSYNWSETKLEGPTLSLTTNSSWLP